MQLKLKTSDFRLRTRARSLGEPTQLASRIFAAGKDLLARAFQHEMDHLDGTVFIDRLRGIKRELIVRKIHKLKKTGKW